MNNKNKKSKRKHRLQSNASKNTSHNKKLDLGFISWAENYTSAVTGQLKHQVQYWKARALTLQQENDKLHKIIHENNYISKSPSNSIEDYANYYDTTNGNKTITDLYNTNRHENNYISKSPSNSFDDYTNYYNTNNENKSVSNHYHSNHDDECLSEDDSECSIQVSKEYIEFLVKNKDFKEQAKLEKERLRLQRESEAQEQLVCMTKAIPTKESLKILYGNDWERISAMETALTCDWITESDRHNPSYWPIIPFNLKDL